MRTKSIPCSLLLALASAAFPTTAHAQAPGTAQDPGAPAHPPRTLPNRTPGAPSSPAPAPSAPALPPAEMWEGTVADGLREVERRAEAGDVPHALALCEGLVAPSSFARWKEAALAETGWKASLARRVEPLADALGLAGPAPQLRAEVHYTAGVLAERANDSTLADTSFQRARALAGPGELRGEAGYQLGTRALLDGELFRSQIPEISGATPGAQGAPGAAPLPPGLPGLPGLSNGAGGASQAPDPLALARAAYQRARERFIERLRDDWRDSDARANTELVQRRLKELDEIEKRRKEEEQKQEQQQKQDPKDKQDKDKQEQDKKDQEKQDKDKQDESNKPDEKKPEDQPKPDEQQKKPEDEKKPDDQKPEEKKDEKAPDPQQTQAEQRELSKEEMTRLLDLLKEREEQWKKLQQQLQHARRGKVKKDW